MASRGNTAIHCCVFANTPSNEHLTLKDYSRALERREGMSCAVLDHSAVIPTNATLTHNLGGLQQIQLLHKKWRC